MVLLSGGADSAVGAPLLSRHDLGEAQHVLVSHIGLTSLAPVQVDIAQRIGDLLPGPLQVNQQIHFSRHTSQFDGTSFRDEASTRVRSFLFLAFGLAIASMDGLPLWIPENGFASLSLTQPASDSRPARQLVHPHHASAVSRTVRVPSHGRRCARGD